MIRKLTAILPFTAAVFAAADASAIPVGMEFQDHGTAPAPDPNAPKVAPSTVCKTMNLYLADVPADATAMRRYRFTGTCTINLAPQGKAARMKTVEVLIDGEYAPKFKRASERVVVQDPELGVSLSTWATCPSDPFVANVTCTDKGMGANKFDKFISRDDAPFARNRAPISALTTAKAKYASATRPGTPASAFWQNPEVFGFSPIEKSNAGNGTSIKLAVKGGAGMCPSEVDFGDGKKEPLQVWSPSVTPFEHDIKHTYEKPGFYKVSVRSLPGCSGEHLAYALVK